jgi:stearoyl-CoA desaturase (delta-9 desaturase)
MTPGRRFAPRSASISTASLSSARLPAVAARRKAFAWKLPRWLNSLPFIGMHVACLSVFTTSVHTVDWIMCGVFYFVRMFGITAGYHRYFSHRSYKTSRPFQFVLAWIGCSALQKGPLWWAAHHRLHHKHSDTEPDVHSPVVYTFWQSHVGWIMDDKNDKTQWDVVPDWMKYPELVWLNRLHWVPGIVLGAVCFGLSYLLGGTGWGGVAVGFILSTVLLYHMTFMINSLAHVFGSRRYETTDDSRNNFALALLTLGEGWHNNHHHYQSAARQGFFWWEVDLSYYTLKALSCVGLVWDLREPPKRLLEAPYNRAGGRAPRRPV